MCRNDLEDCAKSLRLSFNEELRICVSAVGHRHICAQPDLAEEHIYKLDNDSYKEGVMTRCN